MLIWGLGFVRSNRILQAFASFDEPDMLSEVKAHIFTRNYNSKHLLKVTSVCVCKGRYMYGSRGLMDDDGSE